MNYWQAVVSCLSKYTETGGRASRSEHWYFALFNLIVGVVAEAIVPNLSFATSLALLLPSITVGIRRLHDLDRSGWWMATAVTLVAVPVLVYWVCLPGTDGPNRFGPDPLRGRQRAEAAA